MRRLIALVFLFALLATGCGTSSQQDITAAKEYVRSLYSRSDITFTFDKVEGPEYAAVARIPWGTSGRRVDKSAACAVRVWFTWHEEGRTTHDHSIVWVTSDHKAIGWGGDPNGQDWRKYVQSLAKQS